MYRTALATIALMSVVCACAPAAGTNPETAATEPPVEAPAGTVDAVILPADATGFITANPLPLAEDGTVRRDDYGRPYEYALLGQKLPHLTGTMMDGTAFDSDSLDNWTVIDVWGIWCGDCMRDAPYVAALASAIGQDPDLYFLSIHTPASPARITPEEMFGKYGSLDAYFAEKGYSYPVLVDTDASLRQALQISWTPSYLLVSPEGVVKGFRSELSAAQGEPIKDFMKDIALVKAESKKTDLGPLGIGPGGVTGLTAGTPFTLDAVQAAYPDYEVITNRVELDGEALPVFEVRSGGQTLLTLSPDWSLARVNRVSTASPAVTGPGGEQVGRVRLDTLQDHLCTQVDHGGEQLVACTDASEPRFVRTYRPDGESATLVEMSYTFQAQPAGE
ncbi:MAG: TlpA disulfide reductase family protein [Hyphomonas sp.]|nr:TlpA disulfide reductase family protein [Hyphomonas sp.]HRX72528.1 TlpA disulfide reductase family protein [Hyphomonas sp.]